MGVKKMQYVKINKEVFKNKQHNTQNKQHNT